MQHFTDLLSTRDSCVSHLNMLPRTHVVAFTAAGTPFHFLYLLGWIVGKQPDGLSIAAVPVLFCWGCFFVEAVRDGGTNFASEMWAVNFVMFVLSGCLFGYRVAKRTPKKLVAADAMEIWAALLVENVLASSLTCAATWVGVWASNAEQIPLGEGSMLHVARIVAFTCPSGLWYYLQNMVRDRQTAYVDQQVRKVKRQVSDAAEPGGEDDIVWRGRIETARRRVRAIVEGSMDLRMTGLSVEQLNRLTAFLGETTDEARWIRFFTKRVEKRDDFKALCEFDKEYKKGGDGGDESVLTSAPCDDYPWDVAQSKSDSEALWQSWGARARAWDDDNSQIAPFDDDLLATSPQRRQWYALFATAMTANRNPLSVIIAKEQDGDQQARSMVEDMKTGCAQVLSLVDSDPYFSQRRGLVFITDENVPTVTYSPAEVWQAEDAREAVMLGKDTFNLLRQAREERQSLYDDEKADLKSKNVELWGKVSVGKSRRSSC